jgi:uncharacterized oxidoreductase
MPTFHADELRRFACRILVAVGTEPGCAEIVGNSLVAANLAGHDSHGVLRLATYIEGVRSGQVQTAVEPVLVGTDRATARIDGQWGWGQPAMLMATEAAIERAREHAVGVAVVHNCYHIGRVAPYVESVARQGLIGQAMANAGPAVAPYGGGERVMGTNPVAWAVPRAEGHEPLSFDIATSAVAEGKLRVARAKGEHVRPGLLVDITGAPTVDPEDFYDGGALLTFGGHKGYGFSLLAQVLGRGLARLDPTTMVTKRGINGPMIVVIDPTAFTPLADFITSVEAQCAEIKATRPADGFDEVLLPGEPELAIREIRLRDGIPVAERTWDELTGIAAELGVEV